MQKQKKCECGSKIFETINITPSGADQERYFTRCRKCGKVVYCTQDSPDKQQRYLEIIKRCVQRLRH